MKRGFLLKATHSKKQNAEPKSVVVSAPKGEEPKKEIIAGFNAGKGPGCTIIAVPDPLPQGDIHQSQWIVYGSTKEKLLNTPSYPSPLPTPPLVPPYEICSTPDMGTGLFAKSDISSGSLILAERPLIMAPLAITVTPQDPSPQKNKDTLFEYERVLEETLSRLSHDDQVDFRSLYNAFTTDGSGPLLGITKTNNFGIHGLYDGSDFLYSEYVGVYKVASRMNHSCVPNTHRTSELPSLSLQFFATRDIKAGEQLFTPYICATHSTHAERQAALSPYNFICKCSACINSGTPETEDLRKTTENLRKTYSLKSLLLQSRVLNGERTKSVLAEALQLEQAMFKDGLDSADDITNLLLVIQLLHWVCGDRKESEKYALRITERENLGLDKL